MAWHAAIDNLKPVEVAWLIVNATLLIPPEDLEEVLFEGRLDREQRVAAMTDFTKIVGLRPASAGDEAPLPLAARLPRIRLGEGEGIGGGLD